MTSQPWQVDYMWSQMAWYFLLISKLSVYGFLADFICKLRFFMIMYNILLIINLCVLHKTYMYTCIICIARDLCSTYYAKELGYYKAIDFNFKLSVIVYLESLQL